jgi:predicted ATPase
LQKLDVVTGANGNGKSSLYRGHCACVVASLAREGGLPLSWS